MRADNLTNSTAQARFRTTCWSVVLAADQGRSSDTGAALESLCRTYWYPLYSYVRRRGYVSADAQDLTQEFFSRLLQRPFLARVGPEKGRFRSFLLASMNNFLANEWDRAKAEKRGGKARLLSLDADSAESRYAREDVHDQQAERVFESRWALALLEAALARLRAEVSSAGKLDLFEMLKGFLEAEPRSGEYAKLGESLGWTPGAVAVAVHRLRARYRELLLEEVAATVGEAEHVEDELRHLMAALQ